MLMSGAILLFAATAVVLSAFLLTLWAMCRAAADIEDEPIIDLDQLECELSMEFHAWPKAA